MNWLLARLFRVLFGPVSMTDDMMDGITLAMAEEAARMGVSKPDTDDTDRDGMVCT